MLKVLITQLLGCFSCRSHPLSTQMFFFSYPHNHSWRWGVALTSLISPPIGAIRGEETINIWILMECLFKRNILLQSLSHALALKFSPGPHSTKCDNHGNYSQLPLIVVGQGRVVVVVFVVVINAPYPSLSLKNRTKESKTSTMIYNCPLSLGNLI